MIKLLGMRFACLLLFLAVGVRLCAQNPAPATACNISIHGIILDGDHGDELPGAAVFIKELQTGAVTDRHGEYTIKGLCPGTYTFVCQFVGFESRELVLEIKANTSLDLKLYHKTTNLETVVVIATPARALSSQASQSLQNEGLDAVRGGTLGDAIRNLNGVTTIQTGPTISKPVIHGMHSQRVLLLNNGIRQEGQQWGSEHAPEIDPFSAGKITVVKGANSVRYGPDAIAGVLLVEAEPLRATPGLNGHLYTIGSTNGRSGAMAFQVDGEPKEKQQLSWRIQGSGKKAGDLRAPDYYLRNTGHEEWNGSAALGWQTTSGSTELMVSSFNTKLGIYSGAHIGNLTDLQQVILSGGPSVDQPFSYAIGSPYQEVHHHLASLKSSYELIGLGKLTAQYGFQINQRSEFDRKRGDDPANLPPDFELDLNTHTAEVSLDHKAVGPLAGTIGVSGMAQTNRISGRRFLIPEYRAFTAGVYAIERWHIDDYTIEGGVRLDTRQQRVFGQRANQRFLSDPVDLDFTRMSGTLGLTYSPGHHWTYRANAGTAWRAPSINELYSNGVHHGSASFEIGKESLGAETSYGFTGAIEYTSATLGFTLEPHLKWIHNYIYAQPLPSPVLTIRGAFPAFAFTQTDAFFTGFDVSGNWKFNGHYELISSASVVQARQGFSGEYIPFLPPPRIRNMVLRHFSGKGKLLEATIGAGHLTVARQGRYEAGSDFAPPPPGYTLVQLEGSAKLQAGKQHIWIQATVTNALNTRYRDYLNRFRYFADEQGRNFVIRVRIPFGGTSS